MLTVQDVSRQFDDTVVLDHANLTAAQGEIICLLGASGSGKTTLLRIIAGLEQADAGRILLDGKDITRQAVHQRGFGLMFQDYALFPHMNVAQNVAFGLKMQGQDHQEQQTRIDTVLQMVGLQAFAQRSVAELSGGEQQRVALARSLAPRPRLLMLDEPLGSLDAALRGQLVVELRDIIKAAGLTAIYVTHDQQEAFAIADRIAIMEGGQIAQVDTPQQLYLKPQTRSIARFLGLPNFVAVAEIATADGQSVRAKTPLGTFTLERHSPYVLLHPAFLRIAPPQPLIDGALPVTVIRRVFQGALYTLTLQHEPSQECLTMTVRSSAPYIPAVDDTAQLIIRQGGALPID